MPTAAAKISAMQPVGANRHTMHTWQPHCYNLAHRRRAGSFIEFPMNLQPVLGLLRRLLPVMPKRLRSGLRSLVPTAVSLEERLAAFPTDDLPLERPVVVRWNQHQVPFIEAETDRDLAFAFGMVHQHLRGGQIAPVQALLIRPGLGNGRAARPRPRPCHPHPRLRPCRRRVGAPHARGDADLGAGASSTGSTATRSGRRCRRRSSRCWASSPSLSPSATFWSHADSQAQQNPPA